MRLHLPFFSPQVLFPQTIPIVRIETLFCASPEAKHPRQIQPHLIRALLYNKSGAQMISSQAAPVEAPETTTKQKTSLAQAWNVVVHNDPINLMSYVTLVFRRIFGYSKEKSEHHMLEVHHKGRSILWTGGREQAELYVQQLHTHLLRATLERS